MEYSINVDIDPDHDDLWEEREDALGFLWAPLTFWLNENPGSGDCEI